MIEPCPPHDTLSLLAAFLVLMLSASGASAYVAWGLALGVPRRICATAAALLLALLVLAAFVFAGGFA